MHVLVIGGTTFFGRRTVEKLLHRGDQVTVFSRGNRKPPFFDDVEHMEGDRRDYEAFTAMFAERQYDAVIDNIAFTGADVECAMTTFRGNTTHYLVCSSVSVYKDVPRYRMLYEEEADLTKRVGEPYGDGKREMEEYIWVHADDELPVTVLRPTAVEGPHDPARRPWFYVQRLKDGGPILLPYEVPDVLLRVVFAEDLADAFLAAIGNVRAYNKVYNMGGEEVFTLADYVSMLKGILGVANEVVPCPMEIIRRQPELTGYNPGYLGFDSITDISAVRRDIGFRPGPVQERLADTVAWLLSLETLEDSRGYANRRAEIEFAEQLLRARGA
jgi:nucleoside-diphosphate-sugar epimerase